jgi:hypothetical protein
VHFHDLRHTGNAFAAAGGAGIKDLMARMGHDSERAALIYQHQARGADKIITDSIDAQVEAERRRPDDDDGEAGAWCRSANGPGPGQLHSGANGSSSNRARCLRKTHSERATVIEIA